MGICRPRTYITVLRLLIVLIRPIISHNGLESGLISARNRARTSARNSDRTSAMASAQNSNMRDRIIVPCMHHKLGIIAIMADYGCIHWLWLIMAHYGTKWLEQA